MYLKLLNQSDSEDIIVFEFHMLFFNWSLLCKKLFIYTM